MLGGGPTAAVACEAPLQATHAAHDQRGLHTAPEHPPLLLPGELYLLPHTLQPTGAHYQAPSVSGVWQRVSTNCNAKGVVIHLASSCFPTPSGTQQAHPQSCFASLAPLPSFTSSQPSILVLSLIHRHPAFSTVPSVTWSSQTPLN